MYTLIQRSHGYLLLGHTDYTRKVHFKFDPDLGTYEHYIEDAVGVLTNLRSTRLPLLVATMNAATTVGRIIVVTLRLYCHSTVRGLDEDGIQVDWRPDDLGHKGCSSFRLIPFWHEAE